MIEDIKFALRQLLRSPGFTLAAVVTLALGIGVNSAIFSVVSGILLRPLPYQDPARLVMLESTRQTREITDGWVSMADFLDFKEQSLSFEQLAVFTSISRDLTHVAEPERIQMGVVTHTLFPLLGVTPALGRNFLPQEDAPGGERVTILSHELWQRRFGSDPAMIGKMVSIGDKKYLVVGVMPAGFRVAESVQDLWISVGGTKAPAARDYRIFNLVGRLKPAASISIAQAEMSGLAARLAQEYQATNAGVGIRVVSLREYVVGNVRTALLILLGAVGLVLLIACANVANLFLVRAVSREKEMAIRAAMGASRPRLVRQLVTEGLVLAGIGGSIGLLLTVWGTNALKALIPADIPRLSEVSVDWRVLTFAMVMTFATGLVFGIVPAVRMTNQNLNHSLKDRGRGGSAGKRERRVRAGLVITEIAVAMMLLVSAGLLIKSFIRLEGDDPGLDARNVVTMEVALPQAKYPDDQKRAAFFEEAISQIERLPGVEAAGAALQAPFLGFDVDKSTFQVEGARPSAPGQEPAVRLHVITAGYFRTLGIPLLQGRTFLEQDNASAPGVVVINDAMARRYFPGENPIGRRLKTGLVFLPTAPSQLEIVGVVGNVKHFGLGLELEPQMYVTHRQTPWPTMTLLIRSSSEPKDLIAAARGVIMSMDRELVISKVQTMEQGVRNSVVQPRFRALLLGLFAGLALVLAAVGLYSVMAYSVIQRTSEIGIRMAVGATAHHILTMVVREGLSLVVIGLGVGLAGAVVLTRFLSSLLFGITVRDPMTFVGTSLLLAFVALLACYLPARRATLVDPMAALRQE